MSFFRNIRSSITRSKSTSRDTTPVRNTAAFSSRPGSVISNATTTTITTGGGDRRDSVDSRTDSLFNRSDTFILGGTSDQEDNKSHSNSSTLEKKSKKSKVLSKFSTFTKRKKTPSPEEHGVYEHHPSDNATNTYYKWKSEGGPSSLDYDTHSDPFNFLYEQQSNLKALHSSASTNSDVIRSNSSASGQSNNAFDSSTYRKSKMPTQLKEQLEHLKTNTKSTLPEVEDDENEGDKFKTITLNSFRKSFREKFLQQQNDVPHNPAWFVEVEPPDEKSTQSTARGRRESKENRPDFLVFENENYRPHSRSPVRSPERSSRKPRATTRSPVKRNETFRVENPSVVTVASSINSNSMTTTTTPKTTTTTTTTSTQPSISIEIKNSITPNMPVRVVPVGIAKPFSTVSYQQRTQFLDNALKPKTTTTSTAATVPVKSWAKSTRAVSPGAATKRTGRYQTLVQIGNEENIKSQAHSAYDNCCSSSCTANVGTPFGTRGSSNLSTCIQLKGNGASPTIQKRLHSAGSRYSLAVAPVTHNPTTLSSYEMLKNSTKPSALPLTKKPATFTTTTTMSSSLHSKTAKPRHTTYFGDAHIQATTPAITNEALHSRLLSPAAAVARRSFDNTTAATTNGYNSAGDYTPVHNRLYNQQTQSRSSYTAALANSGSGVGAAGITANTGYPNRRDQPQQQHAQSYYYSQTRPRITAMPLVQRRSRSPIKMPWR